MHCCHSSTAAITLATCTSIAHASSAMPGVCIMWHNSCMQSWQVAKVVVVMIAASYNFLLCQFKLVNYSLKWLFAFLWWKAVYSLADRTITKFPFIKLGR